MKPEILDTPHFTMEIKEDILFLTYKGIINLAAAKEVVRSRLEFTGGKACPLFIQGVGLMSIEKEARDYLSSEEGRKGVKAGALFIDSVFNSFLANFFLKVTVNKPKIPTQIFNDKTKALKWLEQFK